MTDKRIEDINISSCKRLITPDELKRQLPVTRQVAETVIDSRLTVRDILDRKDARHMIVVGPCSIHDPKAAIEYGERLRKLADQVSDTLYLVMRVYFEKPRSTVGWKGLINDPHMNGSFEIEEGLHIARCLLLELSGLGLPLATEALDPISPQYLQDLISWSAIGARTTESQTHRVMSSGLSCAVGFKNGTDGGLGIAINALKSVSHPHSFLGIDAGGHVSIVETTGNRYGHIVLRGGNGQPNYDAENITRCEAELSAAGVCPYIMVDCSHDNSCKNPDLQPGVAEEITRQILGGNRSIIGLMIESNINAGNQPIPDDLSRLKYGVSVTDGCIDWKTTEDLITGMHAQLASM
ncbi:MAG: 3-deoxy-7-phosphoheptulonate synthase [Gammaproteobacteria bacterium]|nr:3-deoxy-7-phosphoheptulonate synthase [Gammaproteobacteria bacterium]